jgi:hypothetical protein
VKPAPSQNPQLKRNPENCSSQLNKKALMLVWLIALFLVYCMLKYDFRQTQWMAISFVVLYFAGYHLWLVGVDNLLAN